MCVCVCALKLYNVYLVSDRSNKCDVKRLGYMWKLCIVRISTQSAILVLYSYIFKPLSTYYMHFKWRWLSWDRTDKILITKYDTVYHHISNAFHFIKNKWNEMKTHTQKQCQQNSYVIGIDGCGHSETWNFLPLPSTHKYVFVHTYT